MFYEMILFCSLAEVVGAIISLAEINTGKASHFSGAAAAGVPHCHLATRALEAEAAGLCWLQWPARSYLDMGPPFLPVIYSQACKLQNYFVYKIQV